MTRERAKELAPIIQAWADGKAVQFYAEGMGAWQDFDRTDPDWFDSCQYRIKPEPKTRPMTRGEVLYMVTTTPAMVVRYHGDDPSLPMFYDYDDELDEYEWAIIDKHGEVVGGWHKFEIEE